MNQNTTNKYRTNESFFKAFTHSCLGKLVTLGLIMTVVLFIAHITIPDKETMIEETEDNIRQCIMANDSIQTDGLDDAINNFSITFTEADSTFDEQTWETFTKYNQLQCHRHAFYSTVRIHNNLHPSGTCAGIGIFGLVISTVNFKDLLLNVGPIHKGYGKELIQEPYKVEDEYFGDNPDIKAFHYNDEETE